jgi:hypothetical protein
MITIRENPDFSEIAFLLNSLMFEMKRNAVGYNGIIPYSKDFSYETFANAVISAAAKEMWGEDAVWEMPPLKIKAAHTGYLELIGRRADGSCAASEAKT